MKNEKNEKMKKIEKMENFFKKWKNENMKKMKKNEKIIKKKEVKRKNEETWKNEKKGPLTPIRTCGSYGTICHMYLQIQSWEHS